MTDTASDSRFVYAQAALDVEQDTRSVVIGAGTNAKVNKLVAGVKQTDQYGNYEYVVGPEPIGSAGQTFGDIALDYSTIPGTSDFPFTCGASASGSWDFTGGSYNWYSSLVTQDASGSTSSSSPNIPGFRVLYDITNPAGGTEIGQTDHIHLTVVDGSDGAQATANLYMKLHPAQEVTTLSGPTSTSDPNYYSDMSYSGTVAPGMLVDQSGTIDFSEYTADYAALNASGNYVTACAGVAAISDPVIAAIMIVAGYGSAALVNPAPPASVLWSTLWPTSASQWTGPNGAPPDWTPGVTADELAGREANYCVCNSANVSVAYTDTYYGCDQWNNTGYLGPSNYMLGTNPSPSPNVVSGSAIWTYTGN